MSAEQDRELLEKAAKAAGINVVWFCEGVSEGWFFIPDSKPPHNRRESDRNTGVIWDPINDDGDALRLAVKLGITDLALIVGELVLAEGWQGDKYAATRRAIVRAAASLADAQEGRQCSTGC